MVSKFFKKFSKFSFSGLLFDKKNPILSHNDLHLGNIMRNVEGDFDPNRLIFVDFDLAAYGARAFDINYHTSYWLPDWGKLEIFFEKFF